MTVWLIGCVVIKGAPGSVLIAAFISVWIWAGVSAWLYMRTSSINPFKNRGAPPRFCPPIRSVLIPFRNGLASAVLNFASRLPLTKKLIAGTFLTTVMYVHVPKGTWAFPEMILKDGWPQRDP